jgi:Uma2 family endonuclease
MATTTAKLFTIEDLEAMPDDGHVWELIDGELVRREPVGGRHGALQMAVGGWLWQYLQEHPVGTVFGSDTIYAFQRDPDRGLKPDASFVRADRLPAGAAFDKPLTVLPDLVVEVVSPNDRAGAIDEKLDTYQRFGVPLIWVFWPRRQAITVYAAGQPIRELTAGDELDGGDVLPGFRVAVADLFSVGR